MVAKEAHRDLEGLGGRGQREVQYSAATAGHRDLGVMEVLCWVAREAHRDLGDLEALGLRGFQCLAATVDHQDQEVREAHRDQERRG